VVQLRVSLAWQLFALTAAIRLAYLFIFHPPFETVYWALSTSLLHDGSLKVDGNFITDFEPFYPVFLGMTRWVVGDHALIVQVFQTLIASLGSAFLFRLAHLLTGSTRVAVTSALLFAIDPLLVKQASGASELALATTMVLAFAYCFTGATTTAGMSLTGALLGVLILTRSMTLPLVLCALSVLAIERRRKAAVAFAAGVFVVVAPLVLRNQSVNGSWLPTRSGMNLYLGNSPYTAMLLPGDDPDILQEYVWTSVENKLHNLQSGSPAFNRAADERLTGLALRFVVEHPLETLGQKGLNILYFFSPWLVPLHLASTETRAVIDRSGHLVVENARRRPFMEIASYFAFTMVLLPAAAVGFYMRRQDGRRDAILWSIAAVLVLVHVVYFPATRYRAPMEFVLLFYAAVALARLDR
jgi:Dolichyl-phosphate-mannose-protein mannosyltransferase